MARIEMTEQADFTVLPGDSILLLKVDSTEVQTLDGRNGPWQKLNFKFKVLEVQATGDGSPKANYDDMIGQHIYGSVPFKLTTSPENKLRQWSEAIFNMGELSSGFELDTDLFDGRTVRGITSQYQTKKTDAAGNPFTRHQVESLLPYGQSLGGTPPVAKPDPWAAEAKAAVNSAYTDEPPF